MGIPEGERIMKYLNKTTKGHQTPVIINMDLCEAPRKCRWIFIGSEYPYIIGIYLKVCRVQCLFKNSFLVKKMGQIVLSHAVAEVQYAIRLYNLAQDNIIPVNPLHCSEGYASAKPL